ncbi:MAG: RagB/SusD family nutrient uptake outer membrane protein [Bacteroidota bacterium]
MKRYKITLISIVWLALLGGCDYLDYSEASYMLEEDVFREYSRTKKYLTYIYSQLQHDFNSIDGAMRASGTDEAVHVNSLSSIRRFNDGTWSPQQTIDAQWGNLYSGIYNVNMYLKGIEGKRWDDLKWNEDYAEIMEQFSLYPYEARFLRAYFYFELFKRYGGVPIIEKELSPEEANQVVRASAEDVANFIISECDTVIEKLPATYFGFSTNSEVGRATKGAAMALKARTMMYMASPLHNSTNDVNKWIDAAEASFTIIDSAFYSLEANYEDVVNKEASTELIFSVRQKETSSFEVANFPVGYEGGKTGTCPTQNLVNAYEMAANGLAISDPLSDYDPNNPYDGRDPRLEKTVIVNGSLWKSQIIEVWYGGANAKPKPDATKTGYYLKKYVIESVELSPVVSPKRHEWVLFRLGEVFLNYAEAMNEAYGPVDAGTFGMPALTAVNMIRGRAGMPPFPAGLSKSEFREKLRNERRVELAFEDHRFWDIRRWKIGDETTDIKGIAVGGNFLEGYTYTETDLETRTWDDRMNLYPIPQSERYINSGLSQNPGW